MQGPLTRAAAVVAAAVFVLGACASSSSGSSVRRLPRSAPAAAVPPPSVPALPGVVLHGSRDVPLVALTFDTNMTALMLRQLDQHKVASFDNRQAVDELDSLQVPATIFLAGKWMERYPDETRRLAADPLFELASHSYAHRAFHAPCFGLGPAMPAAEMAPDVEHSEQLLRTFTDRPTPYFRFPGGCYDQAALDAIRSTGVVVIQYDVASGDAFGHSVKAIVANVLDHAQNGSIIVMHLTGGDTAPLTAQALPGVVDALRRRGFRLVKISGLLASG